jgi:hypothetical protein
MAASKHSEQVTTPLSMWSQPYQFRPIDSCTFERFDEFTEAEVTHIIGGRKSNQDAGHVFRCNYFKYLHSLTPDHQIGNTVLRNAIQRINKEFKEKYPRLIELGVGGACIGACVLWRTDALLITYNANLGDVSSFVAEVIEEKNAFKVTQITRLNNRLHLAEDAARDPTLAGVAKCVKFSDTFRFGQAQMFGSVGDYFYDNPENKTDEDIRYSEHHLKKPDCLYNELKINPNSAVVGTVSCDGQTDIVKQALALYHAAFNEAAVQFAIQYYKNEPVLQYKGLSIERAKLDQLLDEIKEPPKFKKNFLVVLKNFHDNQENIKLKNQIQRMLSPILKAYEPLAFSPSFTVEYHGQKIPVIELLKEASKANETHRRLLREWTELKKSDKEYDAVVARLIEENKTDPSKKPMETCMKLGLECALNLTAGKQPKKQVTAQNPKEDFEGNSSWHLTNIGREGTTDNQSNSVAKFKKGSKTACCLLTVDGHGEHGALVADYFDARMESVLIDETFKEVFEATKSQKSTLIVEYAQPFFYSDAFKVAAIEAMGDAKVNQEPFIKMITPFILHFWESIKSKHGATKATESKLRETLAHDSHPDAVEFRIANLMKVVAETELQKGRDLNPFSNYVKDMLVFHDKNSESKDIFSELKELPATAFNQFFSNAPWPYLCAYEQSVSDKKDSPQCVQVHSSFQYANRVLNPLSKEPIDFDKLDQDLLASTEWKMFWGKTMSPHNLEVAKLDWKLMEERMLYSFRNQILTLQHQNNMKIVHKEEQNAQMELFNKNKKENIARRDGRIIDLFFENNIQSEWLKYRVQTLNHFYEKNKKQDPAIVTDIKALTEYKGDKSGLIRLLQGQWQKYRPKGGMLGMFENDDYQSIQDLNKNPKKHPYARMLVSLLQDITVRMSNFQGPTLITTELAVDAPNEMQFEDTPRIYRDALFNLKTKPYFGDENYKKYIGLIASKCCDAGEAYCMSMIELEAKYKNDSKILEELQKNNLEAKQKILEIILPNLFVKMREVIEMLMEENPLSNIYLPLEVLNQKIDDLMDPEAVKETKNAGGNPIIGIIPEAIKAAKLIGLDSPKLAQLNHIVKQMEKFMSEYKAIQSKNIEIQKSLSKKSP